MEGLNRCFLYFIIYGFAGWFVESVYCSILLKKPTNRGFLTGPICPVYAFGALAVISADGILPVMPLAAHIAVVFFGGIVLTGCVEYFTGFLLEFLFNAKWWDYSDQRYNINGRVSLTNSIYFGIMSSALVFLVHPAVVTAVGRIPVLLRQCVGLLLFLLLMADLFTTVMSMVQLNLRLEKINAVMLAIKEKLDSSNWYTSFNVFERIEKLSKSSAADIGLLKAVDALHDKIKSIELDNLFLQKRLFMAFPDMRSVKYPEYLNNIKRHITNVGRHIASRHDGD